MLFALMTTRVHAHGCVCALGGLGEAALKGSTAAGWLMCRDAESSGSLLLPTLWRGLSSFCLCCGSRRGQSCDQTLPSSLSHISWRVVSAAGCPRLAGRLPPPPTSRAQLTPCGQEAVVQDDLTAFPLSFESEATRFQNCAQLC